MDVKYSMEEFIKYLIINAVGYFKSGFTGLILRSVITIANDNLQVLHCSCIAGYD